MSNELFSQEAEQAFLDGAGTQKTAPARIVEYTPDCRIALPIHTTLEIVEQPLIIPVPGAAPYSLGLLHWQENWVGVIDFACLIDPTVKLSTNPGYVLIVAFQRAPGQPLEYGGIQLAMLPETAMIGDSSVCALPEGNPIWPKISLSCCRFKNAATPIIDTGRLFGQSHS